MTAESARPRCCPPRWRMPVSPCSSTPAPSAITATPATGRQTRPHRRAVGFSPSCAGTGRRRQRRRSTRVSALCWPAPGWCSSPRGGVLGRLRPLFSLGLGARLGNGRQYMPWISLEDEVRALLFAIFHDELSGPVNFTGPAPVTNSEFTAAMGRAVNRPTPLMVPGFALRTLLGEFADEGLLGGQRAIPLRWNGRASSSTTTPSAKRWPTPPRPRTPSDPPAYRQTMAAPSGRPPRPIDVRRLGTVDYRDRLGNCSATGRRPRRRRAGHPAAAGAPVGLHRGQAHRTPEERPVDGTASSTPTAAEKSPGTAPDSWSAIRSSGWPNRWTW